MAYKDFFLRAETEAELAAVLPMFRTGDEWIDAGPHHALNLIGQLVIKPAVYENADDENPKTPAVIDQGFHVNLRMSKTHPMFVDIADALVPFTVTPSTPKRVWS